MSTEPDPAAGAGPAAAEPALLRAAGVVRRYGDRVALGGVSVEVHRGEALAIIGPNGAGKTTLLECLAGVQEPDEGTIERPAGGVGWVPQQVAVYSRLTVAENLRFFARLEGVPVEPTVRRMLELTGLEDRAGDPLQDLSGGNRQRVNVAVGLLSDPEAVLLDEPSAALDPRQRARFWGVAEQLVRDGRAVVFTTHDVAEARRHADRVLVLADGEALFDGSTDALFELAGGPGEDLEVAVVRFLEERGH